MQLEFTCTTPDDLKPVAKAIIKLFKEYDVFLLEGDLGAGKTTLVKAICKELGVADEVSSPTFSIVNQYDYPDGALYHFDFYRLKQEEEAYDIGFDEYLDSGNKCFIEWPDKVSGILEGTEYLTVKINTLDDNTRSIVVHD